MALEKFHYDSPHGEIVAEKFKNLPMGIVRKYRNDEAEATFLMIEAGLDAKNLAIFDKLNREQFEDFQRAWMADSQVSLGESSASSKN